MRTTQEKFLKRMEQIAGEYNGYDVAQMDDPFVKKSKPFVEVVVDHTYANIGAVRFQYEDHSRTLLKVTFDFQSGYCGMNLFAANGVEKRFGHLKFDEHERWEELYTMIRSSLRMGLEMNPR